MYTIIENKRKGIGLFDQGGGKSYKTFVKNDTTEKSNIFDMEQ